MTDDAAVMFSTPTAPETPPPVASDQLEAPRPARPSTDAEILRAFYPPENTYRALRAPLQEIADAVNLSADEVGEMHRDIANTFADLEVSVPDAGEWLNLLIQHSNAPADTAQRRAWNQEVKSTLRARYGADADSRLAAAVKVIEKHPDFRQQLSDTGLGSHPKIVLALVESAPRLLGRG